MNINTKRR